MLLSLVKEAAQENRLLEISYIDGKGKQSIRKVEPYEIKDGKLFTHCTQANGTRAFNIDNIVSVRKTDDTFVPRFDIKI